MCKVSIMCKIAPNAPVRMLMCTIAAFVLFAFSACVLSISGMFIGAVEVQVLIAGSVILSSSWWNSYIISIKEEKLIVSHPKFWIPTRSSYRFDGIDSATFIVGGPMTRSGVPVLRIMDVNNVVCREVALGWFSVDQIQKFVSCATGKDIKKIQVMR